ncbi:MAG: hypothetical protein ACI92E_002550 [Oceanicoccus sp.]|jgi:hypothetical protein
MSWKTILANQLFCGAGTLTSAAIAKIKVDILQGILQAYFQDTTSYDGSTIGHTEVRKAIAYVLSKKRTKEHRKLAIGTAQSGLTVAATAGGLTVGSIIPGLGTAIGGAGGFVAGRSLAFGVSGLDQLKRKSKFLYKKARGTQGTHRGQAAAALVNCCQDGSEAGHAAFEALSVLFGDNFDSFYQRLTRGVTYTTDMAIKEVEDRLKSN